MYAGITSPSLGAVMLRYTHKHTITMNNDLQKYSINNPLTVAEHFAKSGLFEDARDMSKALVKILAGRELGLPDMASMTGIHIIKSKPVLGASLIASLIKGSGKYNYTVVELTDEICSIDFYEHKTKCGNSTFTSDDARKAGTQNLSKYPRNMLFARAISNGAKWFTPDIFNGAVYSEGEIPTEERTETTPAEPPQIVTLSNLITSEQRAQLYAVAQQNPSWTVQQVKDYLLGLGFKSSSEITQDAYPLILETLRGEPLTDEKSFADDLFDELEEESQ